MWDTSTREIFIYSDIGPAWADMFGTETLMNALNDLGSGDITIRINSYGGSVDEALAMIEMLSRHDGNVSVTVDSIAASAASLFPAYFPSSAAPHARIMIHNPWSMAMGDSEELRRQADILDMYRDSLITIYESAMQMDREAIVSLLDAETWYTAQDALEVNLVDNVMSSGIVAARAVPKDRFKNVPMDLVESQPEVIEPVVDVVKSVASKELTLKLQALRLKCKLQKAL